MPPTSPALPLRNSSRSQTMPDFPRDSEDKSTPASSPQGSLRHRQCPRTPQKRHGPPLPELGCISPEQKLRNTHTRKRTHEQHVLIENEVSFARHPTDVIDAASEHCVHCKYPDTDARLKNSK